MKLLYAIRKKGIDIEAIYNQNVKTPREDESSVFSLNEEE